VRRIFDMLCVSCLELCAKLERDRALDGRAIREFVIECPSDEPGWLPGVADAGRRKACFGGSIIDCSWDAGDSA